MLGRGRMKALRAHAYGTLKELRLEAARVPQLRAPDELLVRVRAASLNPIDVAMVSGYGARILNALRSFEGNEGVEFPLVAGRDFLGEVERAGPEARFQAGERVWGVVPLHRAGSHAEYVTVRSACAGSAPRALTDMAAAGALYAALTACAALRAAGLPPGERARSARVLLLGLGGVGQAALQLLVHAGAEVIVGCAADAASTALDLGAAATFDRHSPDYGRQLEESGPYAAILDCAGVGGSGATARRWQYSRYVTLTTPLLRETDSRGLLAGGAVAGVALANQCAKALATAGSRVPQVRWAFFEPRSDDIELVRRLAERGEFSVKVEHVFGWRNATEAYERMAEGSARGKLVIDMTHDYFGTESEVR